MAYRLDDGEGMASGVRRIVAEELRRAVDQLEGRGDPPEEAVHDARKRLKKSRSALRLVRDDLGDAVRRAENAVMRDAGRRLSGMRDADVLLRTLDGLRGGEHAPSEAAVRTLRGELEARRAELALRVHAAGDGEAAAVARQLADVTARAEGWPLGDEGFDAARVGLRRLYERGRDAMGAALGADPGGGDEAWHEWRKRVKDLWYALRILEPVAPAMLHGAVEEAGRLSDVLGDHNDLAVLERAIGSSTKLGPRQAAALRAAVLRRRAALRAEAVPLGRRLYAERPGAFARRLAAYWDARAAGPPLDSAAHAV